MEKKNTFWTEMARPVVVLVVICLVASALLGFTNAKTAPVIEENRPARKSSPRLPSSPSLR